MKALTSFLALFLLTGCSVDEPQPDAINTAGSYKNSQHSTGSQNPYAAAGAIYQSMLDAYYLLPAGSGDIMEIIDRTQTIALNNTDFVALNDSTPYTALSEEGLAPYLEGGSLNALLSPNYSSHASGILLGIADELEAMKAQDLPFEHVDAYFKDLDSALLVESSLSAPEKSALLTTTALVCNALDNDRKKKRRDRDWEWMTTHLAATANAALESLPQAMMVSFATDVYND